MTIESRARTSGGAAGPETNPITKLILIVDDEPDIRKPLARMLESRGYGTLEASNGAEALDFLRRLPTVDLVLMDVMMPTKDGFDTLHAMRREQPLKRTPVVMITGKAETANAVHGYSLGADYYIAKPFSNDTVLNAVEYLIGDLPADERMRLESSL